jgi:hypothetical protein
VEEVREEVGVDEEREGPFIGAGAVRKRQEIAGINSRPGVYCGEIPARDFSAVETTMTWPGQRAPPIIEKGKGKEIPIRA